MLLFREKWVLLLSKSKMAEISFKQSGAQLRIQDGGIGSDTLEARPQVPVGVCFWRENSPPDAKALDRHRGFPWRLILVLLWISFTLYSLIRWTSKRDNFIFSTPAFVTWRFCFLYKVCNMIPLFSQKHTKEDMLAFFSCWRKMK